MENKKRRKCRKGDISF